MIFININYRKLAINLWGINDNLRLMNIYLFLSKKKIIHDVASQSIS